MAKSDIIEAVLKELTSLGDALDAMYSSALIPSEHKEVVSRRMHVLRQSMHEACHSLQESDAPAEETT